LPAWADCLAEAKANRCNAYFLTGDSKFSELSELTHWIGYKKGTS